MSKTTEQKREIDTGKLMSFYLHKWGILLAAVMIGVLAGFTISRFMITPGYTSSTKIIVLSRSDSDKGNSVTTSDLMTSDYLKKDYLEIIKSRDVIEKVISDLDLPDTYRSLSSRISVSNVDNTRIINISVTDPDPEAARKIAVDIRDTAKDFILSVTDIQAINTIEEAYLPSSPSSPDVKRWSVTGGLLLFLIAAVWLFIRFATNNTLDTPDDIEQYLSLSVLASIPAFTDEGIERRRHSRADDDRWLEKSMSSAGKEAALGAMMDQNDRKEVAREG